MDNFLPTAITSLAATPPMLMHWLPRLSPDLLRRREQPDSWDTINIVKHLISGEQTDWMVRLQLMIEHKDRPTPPVYEPFDRFGHQQNKENNIDKLLEEFQRLRTDNLALLQQLAATEDLLSLRAIHPALGPVMGRQLLATWVVHDQTHIYQISRNITSAYAQAVGPWREYLRIVNQNKYA